jgi:hypothetical protein
VDELGTGSSTSETGRVLVVIMLQNERKDGGSDGGAQCVLNEEASLPRAVFIPSSAPPQNLREPVVRLR